MSIKILPYIVKTQPHDPNKSKPFKSQIEKPKPKIKREDQKIFFIN